MRRRILIASGVVTLSLVALVGAWALVGRRPAHQVLGGVHLAGSDIGGVSTRELSEWLDDLEARLTSEPIRIETSEGAVAVEPRAVDLAIDRRATVAQALAAGRADGPLAPFRWLRRTLAATKTPLVVTVDEDKLDAALAEIDPTRRAEPVEPKLAQRPNGSLVIVDGVPGRGLDGPPVARALVAVLAGAGEDDLPPTVTARPVTLEPRFEAVDFEPLLEEARGLTARPVTVVVDGRTGEVSPQTVRSWVEVDTTGPEATLYLSGQRAADDLAALVPEAGDLAGEAAVEIRDGAPAIVPGREGTRCCAPEAGALVLSSLRSNSPFPVDVPLTVRPPSRDTSAAERLNIAEMIGDFTTRHAAGESRVTNIHRIADLVRGQIIEPGGTFSVNEFVGPRTRAKGFVEGGVIQNGVFDSSVGGGISQFATTLFNAAFFGGLDFDEYQSHSIYISRYPYGREATLSFPAPDLVIRNDTPHGVLIWTEYTSSSITVSLWSTRHSIGEQTGQTSSPSGRCTVVRTERTRTYVDGRREVDSVVARYRPSEGVNC